MSTTVVQTDSVEDDLRDNETAKAKKQKSACLGPGCKLDLDGRSPSAQETAVLTSNRPILTPKTVLPIFFAIGIVFAPIGGLLLWASYS
ncbi:hypothetical protein DV737_g1525, partial [Chaetothyriales sp. CBS 132003]